MKSNNLAILTGSEGMLGTAIARLLRENSFDIICMDKLPNAVHPYSTTYIPGDITLKSCIEELFSISIHDIASQYQSLSLINNAGVAVFTPTEDRSYEEYRIVTDVNMWAPIMCTIALSKKLNEFRLNYPEINLLASCVNISSIYGVVTPNPAIYVDTPRHSSEIYGATKAALNHLTRYFSARYADKICVNAICPGGILNTSVQGPEFIQRYSSLVPMGRLCTEDDVASMVKFLCIDRPSYLTGQVISLDGGLTTW